MSDSSSNVITLHKNMKIAEKKLSYNNKAFTSKRVTAKKNLHFDVCEFQSMWSN